MSAPLPVGPFTLESVLGQGGMGQVWAARHTAEDWPVAIKVITAEVSRQRGYQRAFRREVRAVARLDHPGIVRVHDFGQLPRDAPAPLPGGSPYLVMDRVDGGALSPNRAGLDWPTLQPILLDLLDALGHAHARGVIHRDLKPDNVLLDGDGRPVLTDFGVAAHEAGEDLTTGAQRAGQTAGTPAYMAPEQIRGLARDQGPWTDLYALGCMVWELITGRPPLLRDQPLATLVAQMTEVPPRLRARFPIPSGLEDWLRRLLSKPFEMRFSSAADARWALKTLEAAPLEATPWPAAPTDRHALGTAPTLAGPTAVDLPTAPTAPTDEALGPASRVPRSAVPAAWHRDRSQSPRPARPGAGLGLFELRSLPFVGREAERDGLWAALRWVVEDGQPRGVLLSGASGYGKSALATWLIRRACETGAAQALAVRYSAEGGRAHGFPAALRRLVNGRGLGRAALVERIQHQLGPLGYADAVEAQALAEVIEPANDAERAQLGVPRLAKAEDVLAVVRRLLRRMAADRPLVLHLDDVQWGPRGLAFAHDLMTFSLDDDVPLLVVATVNTDQLSDRPEAAAQIQSFDGLKAVQAMPVGPLPRSSRHTLIRAMLGLSAELARRIEERTDGNPLFAVQLVKAWVQQGLLVAGPAGIDRAPGADLDGALPDDVHGMWDARVALALADASEAQAQSLELAATLGGAVEPDEWHAACAAAELPAATRLLERWLDQGLVELNSAAGGLEDHGQWRFAHAMLREALLRRARSGGRDQGHHDACAFVLQTRPETDPERIAHHLMEAGQYDTALPALQTAAEIALDQTDVPHARRLVRTLMEALATVGPPEADPRWGGAWVLEARLALLLDDFDTAARKARAAQKAAKVFDWPAVHAHVNLLLGSALRDRGEAAQALPKLENAVALGEALGDRLLVARAQLVLGSAALRLGQADRATGACLAARAAAQAVGDGIYEGLAEISLGQLAKRAGDLSAASRHNAAARAAFEGAAYRDGLARAANQRGELARLDGDLDTATAAYREALDRWQIIDAGAAVFAQANLGLTLMEADRPAEALPVLDRARKAFRKQRRWPMVAALLAASLPGHAAADAWADFRRTVDEALDLITRTGLRDVDTARMLERAGHAAAGKGQAPLARSALRLAIEQWKQLGRADRARAAERALDALAR